MQCNLDARGKAVRLISGIIVTFIGVVLVALLLLDVVDSGWAWTGAVVALLLGAFQIFEARKGWCVIRAMGFRTPI